MAYDEKLAGRIEKILSSEKIKLEAKKMMGGLCFMVNDKMCLGVEKDRIMARVGPDNYEQALKQKGAREMDFTGKSMRGFVFVDSKFLKKDSDLNYWVSLCLQYNKIAKASIKKKKEKGQKSNSSQDILFALKKIIEKTDKKVKGGAGKVMGTDGYGFSQDGVFKYALAKTKFGYSFHSMAIYANPDLYNDFKSKLPKAKFQKGCVNFKSPEDFPIEAFEEHMKKSAKVDFSPVIEHYKKKQKSVKKK